MLKVSQQRFLDDVQATLNSKMTEQNTVVSVFKSEIARLTAEHVKAVEEAEGNVQQVKRSCHEQLASQEAEHSEEMMRVISAHETQLNELKTAREQMRKDLNDTFTDEIRSMELELEQTRQKLAEAIEEGSKNVEVEAGRGEEQLREAEAAFFAKSTEMKTYFESQLEEKKRELTSVVSQSEAQREKLQCAHNQTLEKLRLKLDEQQKRIDLAETTSRGGQEESRLQKLLDIERITRKQDKEKFQSELAELQKAGVACANESIEFTVRLIDFKPETFRKEKQRQYLTMIADWTKSLSRLPSMLGGVKVQLLSLAGMKNIMISTKMTGFQHHDHILKTKVGLIDGTFISYLLPRFGEAEVTEIVGEDNLALRDPKRTALTCVKK